jgi:hypothetical protein
MRGVCVGCLLCTGSMCIVCVWVGRLRTLFRQHVYCVCVWVAYIIQAACVMGGCGHRHSPGVGTGVLTSSAEHRNMTTPPVSHTDTGSFSYWLSAFFAHDLLFHQIVPPNCLLEQEPNTSCSTILISLFPDLLAASAQNRR